METMEKGGAAPEASRAALEGQVRKEKAGEGLFAGENSALEGTADASGKRAEKAKRRRSDGAWRGGRAALLVLQHTALAVAVFSLLVMAACTTVQIEGVCVQSSYTNFRAYPNPGEPFEESKLFNEILDCAMMDVIRCGAVQSQMETDGAFDGEKLVDVTAYNHRGGVLPERYLTAVYRLEDLLKWQQYGFEYQSRDMTGAQAAAFLGKAVKTTAAGGGSQRGTVNAGALRADPSSDASAADAQTAAALPAVEDLSGFVEGYQSPSSLGDHGFAEALEVEEPALAEALVPYEDDGAYAYEVLVNRYQTAEGKNLEDYAQDWDSYEALCENVEKAAEDLSHNYEEYTVYRNYFDVKNSNVRYLIENTAGEKTKVYTNMDAESGDRERIQKLMDAMDGGEAKLPEQRFFYYNPADMRYLTNTGVREESVREQIQNYAYAYPETARIWVSVDPTYAAKDDFVKGGAYLPNLWLWAFVALAAGLLYLALFVWQTAMTGRALSEDGTKTIRPTAFDKIPTEGALAIAAAVIGAVGWALVMAVVLLNIDPTSLSFYREAVSLGWFRALVFVGVFAADAIFTFFFYSLVRRIKAGTLWSNSFLRRLLVRCKEFALDVYDNGGVVLRVWLPYSAFLALNLLLLLWAFAERSLLPLLLAAAIDLAVGILLYKDAKERQRIVESIETIAGGQVDHQIHTEGLHGDNKHLAKSVNSIGKGIKEAVEISMKDERMKADLITNVSHDIKTPLTSIINYVDLLKREDVGSGKVRDYIRVLDEKSQRLKQLTDDLVEASKISSGTICLHFERINLTELMNQTIGEFSEKFDQKGLVTVMNVNTKRVTVEADSRRIWRVMENLFNNVYKYAMPGTRVYVALEEAGKEPAGIRVSVKNISENYLNCKPEELTERFIRGDESRTTEGSGLGLSIAKNLTLAQNGSFEIELDGDLFKVYMTFPLAE